MSYYVRNFVPVLSQALLDENNFFELYPFDGGGSFINHSLVGSTADDRIAHAILKERALKDFGPLESIDYLKFERWSSIEKSCWINRMYFIVPLARVAKRTGDRELGKLVRHIIFDFMTRYPAPCDAEAVCDLERRVKIARDRDYNAQSASFDNTTEYQWFDFQPGSRILHVLHAVYFLRDMELFSDEDYGKLDLFIAEHARAVYEAEHFFYTPAPGNHQALRALALLTAAVCFHGDARAAEWFDEAHKLCEYHIMNDFLPDGMGTDLSPSYHFFECWICRDAAVLAERGGKVFSEVASERLKKAFAICEQMRLPDGKTPVISDGYPLNMSVFLQTLPASPDAARPRTLLVDAKMAIRRESDSYLFFDCAPLLHPLAHYHSGKQSITLYFGGKPFVIEGGCCNYDDPAFAEFFKQSAAHSTLLIENSGDSVLQGRYTWLKAATSRLSQWHGDTIQSTLVSDAPNWRNVRWHRSVTMTAEGAGVTDRIEIPDERRWTLLFMLPPEVVVTKKGTSLLLCNNDVTVEFASSAAPEIVSSRCVRGFDIVPTLQLRLNGRSSAEVISSFTVRR